MINQWKINLYTLCCSQFLIVTAMQLIIPFLPLYLKELGIQEAGALTLWSGIIASANFLPTMILLPLWGSLSDRYGRKMMVIRSTFSLAVFTSLMALATNVYQLFALRILMGTFSGFNAAAVTMIATGTPEANLGFALGMLQTGMMAGIVTGPLIGGVVASLWGYRQTFLLSGLLYLLACILPLVLVKERFQPVLRPVKGVIVDELRWAFSERRFLLILLIMVIIQFAVRSVEPIFTLYVSGFYHRQAYLSLVAGILFAAVGVGNIISSPVLGKLSDRRGTKKILIIAMLGGGATYFTEGLTSNVWALGGLQMVLGVSLAGMIPTCNAMVGHLVPMDKRGAAFGLMGSANSLGYFLGPLGGGIIAAAFGLRSMFFVTAAVLVLSAWVISQVLVEPQKQPDTASTTLS